MNILKEGNRHTIVDNVEIIPELGKGNYILKFSVQTLSCWLEKTEDFTFPEKLYDIDTKLIDFVSQDFNTSNDNIGALLIGNKGQGKSLTAKQLAKKVNIPVIIIKDKIPNNIDFISLLNSIKQDYTLFVDEFEKFFKTDFYESESEYHSQNIFLSFMDGVITRENKILFLLTSNDEISSYFINRPSRIKYLKEYLELSEEVLNEIIDDKLINKDYKEDLLKSVSMVNLNVDLLISIISNINKFNMPFSEFSDIFNYQFESYKYNLTIIDENGNKEPAGSSIEQHKPDKDDNYLFGHKVVEFVEFTKNTIKFTSFKNSEFKPKTKKSSTILNELLNKSESDKIYYTVEATRFYGGGNYNLIA